MSKSSSESSITKSTTTAVAHIQVKDNKGCEFEPNLNVSAISRFVNVYSITSKETETHNGNLCGTSSADDLSRGVSHMVKFLKKRRKKKARTQKERTKIHNNKYKFDNQVSLVYMYWGFRKINCKIFNNGKLQMTGIKYDQEVKWVGENIIRILKDAKIPIYTSIEQLPEKEEIDKTGITYALVYNPKTGKMNYYRWNFYEQFGNIPRLSNHNYKLQEWNTDTEIHKYIKYMDEKKQSIITELNLLTSAKKQREVKQLEDEFKDFCGMQNYIDSVRNADNAILEQILEDNKKTINTASKTDDIIELDMIDKSYLYKLEGVRLGMVNADFNIGFPINNTKLYKILRHLKFKTSYNTDEYPGLKIYYYLNKLNTGKCECKPHCASLTTDKQCNLLTIMVFQSGYIQITGSKNIEHTRICYNYMRQFLIDKKSDILGKYSEDDLKKIANRTNEIRRFNNKARLFYCQRDNIDFGDAAKYKSILLSRNIIDII